MLEVFAESSHSEDPPATAGRSVPAVIVVAPEYVLTPDSVVVPVPTCVSVPGPSIAPATVSALVRFSRSVVLLVIGPVPSFPAAPPSSSVPLLIVVRPLKVLAPVRVCLPLPIFVSEPTPEIAPSKVLSFASPKVSAAAPRESLLPVPSVAERDATVWKFSPLISSVPPEEMVTAVVVGSRLPMPEPVPNHFLFRKVSIWRRCVSDTTVSKMMTSACD